MGGLPPPAEDHAVPRERLPPQHEEEDQPLQQVDDGDGNAAIAGLLKLFRIAFRLRLERED